MIDETPSCRLQITLQSSYKKNPNIFARENVAISPIENHFNHAGVETPAIPRGKGRTCGWRLG